MVFERYLNVLGTSKSIKQGTMSALFSFDEGSFNSKLAQKMKMSSHPLSGMLYTSNVILTAAFISLCYALSIRTIN
jgi:hypothetical protein